MKRTPAVKSKAHPFPKGQSVAWAAGLPSDVRLGLVDRNGPGPFRIRKVERLDDHTRRALRETESRFGYYIDGLQPHVLVAGSLLRTV